MPENASTAEEPQASEPEFEPITSQDDLDRIIQKRVARERSKYADYEDLAVKAAKFDEAVEADKTELDKATERADKAEAEAVASRLEASRYQVIAEFNLPDDLHELVTGGDVEEMRERAKTLAGYVKPSANLHQVVPTDGKFPAKKPRSTADAFANAFEGRI